MSDLRQKLVSAAIVGLPLVATVALGGSSASAQQQRNQMSYAEDVAPILKGYCESCHKPGGKGYEQSGLDLTSYEGLMKGTKFGAMVVPGKPDASNLIVMIKGEAKVRMPLAHKPLPNALVSKIWSWIFEGAKNN